MVWPTLGSRKAKEQNRTDGGSEPPCNTWSLGPSEVLNRDGISIGSAVFAGLTSVTDRPRYSVSNNRRNCVVIHYKLLA